MKMNMDALKALELKLAEYSKANRAFAEHESENANSCVSCDGSCNGNCQNGCKGTCQYSCADATTTRFKH